MLLKNDNKILTAKFLCFLTIVFLVSHPASDASEPRTYTKEEVNQLLERLEENEERLNKFESELRNLKSPNLVQEPEYNQKVSSEESQNSATDYKSIIDEFDKKWDEQNKINKSFEDSLNDFVLPGTSLNTMKIGGRIHADYWAFPEDSPGVNVFETRSPEKSPNDRIGFRRARLGAKGNIWKNMDYKLEMEFAGGDDSEFRDIYLSFKKLPIFHTLRIGNQKRPYGLDHLNSSRYNVFMERPFVIESFNQDARRLGIQSLGHSENLEYNWRFGVFNQRLIQDEGFYISDHAQGEIAGRFAHTFWYDHCNGHNYAHWAVSGTAAHPDGSTNNPGENFFKISTKHDSGIARKLVPLFAGLILGELLVQIGTNFLALKVL